MSGTKTAFIAIVGKTNVGKSSILNRLIGSKLAIVSPKPQTTRTRIVGVLTDEDGVQLVFTDTPGFHRPRNRLGERMVRAAGESIEEAEGCLLVLDAADRALSADEEALLQRLRAKKLPAVLALNKIDTLKSREALALKIVSASQKYDFAAVVPVSARTGEGLDALLSELKKSAVESVHFFPDDVLTDQPERVLAGELIREKMLWLLQREIPHGTAVCIESMRERPGGNLMDVTAVIYCEKESHKGIIIGRGGSMLKKISSLARRDMEAFFGVHINLKCWVKVRADWRNREGLIHNFGLD